jgi:hypothetical protein
MPLSIVYVLSNPAMPGLVKIGRTSSEDAVTRIAQLYRVNPKREFFSIEPDQAIAILKLLHVQDATTEVEQAPSPIGSQEIAAGTEFAARRPNLNFEEMGIPVGSELKFTERDTSVFVTTPRKVRLDDVEMSLTAATRSLLGLDYSVAPGPYWMFNGRSLRDIYNDTYPLA